MTRIDLRCDCGCNPPRPYGYRVLLDGSDVSARCFLADDVRGEVGLYLEATTVAGHFLKDWATDGAALEHRKGTVVLIPPAD